jgi:predicted Zn-dependent protease
MPEMPAVDAGRRGENVTGKHTRTAGAFGRIIRGFTSGWIFAALILAAGAGVRAQTDQDLVDMIETGRISEARERLGRLEQDRRSPEQVLFLKGLLTADGDSAAHIYERFLMLYPKSRFGDEACMRLAQHKYAQGLYQAALRALRHLMQRYPDSPVFDKCLYMAGMCHQNLNHPDSAAVFFRNAVARWPDSEAGRSARDRLAVMGAAAAPTAAVVDSTARTSAAGPAAPRYAVQVGAFASQANALMRKSFFANAGYQVTLRMKKRDDATLYLVWIGTYATMDEARQTGEKLKSKYGLSYQLVTE